MNISQYLRRANTLEKIIATLIGVNIFYWLFTSLFFGIEFSISKQLAFYPKLSNSFFKPWTYLSYIIIHQNVLHLFINMFVLWSLGRLFIRNYGFRSFLALFLMGGIAGALNYQIVYNIFFYTINEYLRPLPLLGASGSIICIVFAYIFREPYLKLRINKAYAIPYTYLAYAFLFIQVLSLLWGGGNIGGELAHLGGGLTGMAYAILLRNQSIDISEPIAKTIDWLILKWEILSYKIFQHKKNSRKKPNVAKLQEIERKMRYSGYRSLDEEERNFLLDNSNKRLN